MTNCYPYECQRLGIVVLTTGQETVYAAASMERAVEGVEVSEITRTLRACLREPAVSEAFNCPSTGFNSTWHEPKAPNPKLCWFCFLVMRTCGVQRLPAAKVSGQVVKLD